MSKNLTPQNFLNLFADELNKGNLSYLLSLYETDACFVSESGEIVKGQENIRQILQKFIDMKGKLETTVKNLFDARDIALVISEWSFNGIGPDGKAVSLSGKATDVLRQQSDGTWRIVIDNPWKQLEDKSLTDELKKKVLMLENQLKGFDITESILQELLKASEMEFQRKSELESKAVSMITMSGTIATLFMGFGSILLRDVPLKDLGVLISGSIILMVEVILTTIAIKYSLEAYKLSGKPYFNPYISTTFGRNKQKNRDILIQLKQQEPGMFIHNIIETNITATVENAEVNNDKTKKIVKSQWVFLLALSMIPIFAFIIMIHKFIS